MRWLHKQLAKAVILRSTNPGNRNDSAMAAVLYHHGIGQAEVAANCPFEYGLRIYSMSYELASYTQLYLVMR